MSAPTRDLHDQVRDRVAAMARPELVSRVDLLAWLDSLEPRKYGFVADLVFGGGRRG